MTTSTLLRNINPESENIHLPHVQKPLRLDFADFPEFSEFIRNRSDHKFTTDICFLGRTLPESLTEKVPSVMDIASDQNR